jgi:hypothetical protein
MSIFTKIADFFSNYEITKSVKEKKNETLVIDKDYVKSLNLIPNDPRENINDLIMDSLNEDSLNYVYKLQNHWKRDLTAYYPTWFKYVDESLELSVELDPFENIVKFCLGGGLIYYPYSFALQFKTQDIPVKNILLIGNQTKELWKNPNVKDTIIKILKQGVTNDLFS